MKQEPNLQSLIQDYFTTHLRDQKNLSAHTIASYRDTFVIFFEYSKEKLKKNPSTISLDDLNSNTIINFLNWLEESRGSQIRTRNQRLAAIRGFLNFVSFKIPSRVNQVSSVRMVPRKRHDQQILGYLTIEEMKAIIASSDQSTFSGARDFVLWSVMYNTGARVSEVVGMKRSDLDLTEKTGSIRIMGKGRKQRSMPLWGSTVKLLRRWLERPELTKSEYIFTNRLGGPLTRSGVEDRLEKAVKNGATKCPSLSKKAVSPHTIRHTTAMHLLQAGVDITVIALWLGHSSIKTTHIYVEADLKMKEKALAHLQKPKVRGLRYKADNSTLAFLQSL
jgi:site-specific recombinase XerD